MSADPHSSPDGAPQGDETGVFLTKTEYVGNWLREQILSGEFAAGDRIRQDVIARQLRMSITPVREALRLLEAEGYLVSLPHVGVRVTNTPRDRFEEVFPLRVLLETFLTGFAAERITAADLAYLHDVSSKLERAVADGEVAEQRRLNIRFHRRIWESAQYPTGLELVNRLWAKFPSDLFLYMGARASKTVQEHARILEALEAYDVERAKKEMEAHIESGLADHRRFAPPAGVAVEPAPAPHDPAAVVDPGVMAADDSR